MQTVLQRSDRPTLSIDWSKAAVLLGMGAYLTILMLTGAINNYMNQRFQWMVVVAACLFVMLGIYSVWRLLRRTDETHTLDDNLNVSHAGHAHSSISWSAIGIMCIPLMLAVLVPSQPLGANAVNGGISLNPVGVGDAGSVARSDTDRNILDWLREFNRVENPATFNGDSADLIGFIYREPYMTDDQFMLARFTLSCCVADAFAIGIPVITDDATAYVTGDWLRIQGTFTAGQFGDNQVPILRPTSLQTAQIPSSPYLYP